jgi:hypothetical protein
MIKKHSRELYQAARIKETKKMATYECQLREEQE